LSHFAQDPHATHVEHEQTLYLLARNVICTDGLSGPYFSAAVSVATGEVVADPFKPTAAVVELLVLRAAHLRPARARAHTPAQTLVRRARHGLGRRRAADVTST
jgi:hypothetical protein